MDDSTIPSTEDTELDFSIGIGIVPVTCLSSSCILIIFYISPVPLSLSICLIFCNISVAFSYILSYIFCNCLSS